MSDAFVVNSSKMPVAGVRRAIRSTALTTPPWTAHHDDWPRGDRRGAQGYADAMVERGDRLAARERDGVGIELPVRPAVALDERVERHAVALGPGIVLAQALVDVHLERRRAPARGARPSRPPAGSCSRTARRPPARRSRRGGRAGRSHCRRPRADKPGAACAGRRSSGSRWPSTRRGGPAPDASAATRSTAHSSRSGHRTDRQTFRSECQPGGCRRSVGSQQWRRAID